MNYVSTRDPALSASLSQAIESGLAPDGGLFVPKTLAPLGKKVLKELEDASSLSELASLLLRPFFESDALDAHLSSIAAQALDFPVPLIPLDAETSVLELFHGPTAAFKDVGARFLAGCFGAMPGTQRTILVATSGDTGGAVASAFHKKPGAAVCILFPAGGVSPLQEKQLTCWDGNVLSLKVRGSFDDCQRLVKEAFNARSRESALAARNLTSANSISIGRLLPQMAYYASSSLAYAKATGQAPGYAIPTGNVGNALAAVWALKLGLPIREILLATNANRVVPDYFATGRFTPAPSVKTLANAMDVGNPSNLERFIHLASQDPALKGRVRALSVSDHEIREAIRQGPSRYGRIACPHTAAAIHGRELQTSPHWIVVATAHPAKFGDVIEPLLGQPIPMPPQLERLVGRPSRFTEIDARLEELVRAIKMTVF